MESQASATRAEAAARRKGQHAATRRAPEVGDDIRKTHPEIAEEYRNGLTASELVDHPYGVSQQAAIVGLDSALGLTADRAEPDDLDFRRETDETSAVIDLLFSLHGMIVAHTAALAALRSASPAALWGR